MRSFFTAIIAAFALCTVAPAEARNVVVTLNYAPPSSAQIGSPVLTLGAVSDGREHGSNWLGAIRGGYGNPLKVLVVEGAVSDAVRDVVRRGLEARNLIVAEGARYRLDVHVGQFDCNQYVRKEAHVILITRLVDVESNAVIYEQTTRADRVEGSIMSMRTGIFASPDALLAVANGALQEAVDRALDDPGLRTSLSGATPVITPAVTAAPAAESPAPATP